jgi:hypothetical protein
MKESGYDATYLLKSDFNQMYTIWHEFEHPGVLGRRINGSVHAREHYNYMDFDEGDPSWKSPVRRAQSFNMMMGSLRMTTITGGTHVGEKGTNAAYGSTRQRIFFRVVR